MSYYSYFIVERLNYSVDISSYMYFLIYHLGICKGIAYSRDIPLLNDWVYSIITNLKSILYSIKSYNKYNLFDLLTIQLQSFTLFACSELCVTHYYIGQNNRLGYYCMGRCISRLNELHGIGSHDEVEL